MDFRFRWNSGHTADITRMAKFEPISAIGGRFCCDAQHDIPTYNDVVRCDPWTEWSTWGDARSSRCSAARQLR